jgi:excisionase family DNA binding protein
MITETIIDVRVEEAPAPWPAPQPASHNRPQDLSDEDYVQAALQAFFGRSASPGPFRQQATLAPARALSVGERDALAAVGLLPDAHTAADAEAARQNALNAFFLVFQTALTTAEAAKLLGKDPSRIRQRVREGSLLALAGGGEIRLPQAQFHQNAEIPGLGAVLRALPKGIDTLEALSWLDAANPDLPDAQGRPSSPRDYLLRSGDVAPVRAAAEGLARGQAG